MLRTTTAPLNLPPVAVTPGVAIKLNVFVVVSTTPMLGS
jgi:hypothetical protein